jgi:hypothetical protein
VEGLLGGKRGQEGVGGGGEGGTEGIADGLEYIAIVALNGLSQQRIVASEGEPHGVGMGVPEFGAALDVSEEKCNSSRRKSGHGSTPKADVSAYADRFTVSAGIPAPIKAGNEL